MFCANCGHDCGENPFCAKCGTRVKKAETLPLRWLKGKPCPHCGGVGLDGKCCAFCGVQLFDDEPVESGGSPYPKPPIGRYKENLFSEDYFWITENSIRIYRTMILEPALDQTILFSEFEGMQYTPQTIWYVRAISIKTASNRDKPYPKTLRARLRDPYTFFIPDEKQFGIIYDFLYKCIEVNKAKETEKE